MREFKIYDFPSLFDFLCNMTMPLKDKLYSAIGPFSGTIALKKIEYNDKI
ncbi:hypothetical protein KIS1582_4318 [Cytobacillus firmus]|jgi:hypothetical protein|uniref:Uncharacterized protein n=1 Tax=Cytobacillus firmus TaxID=1399 RepID=A0A380Y2F8_CYTFI|nr:hypothetical protein KIS1582_4318 [Cytobacillus firmus]SUV09064.1 Uncharacterised protein [Cytobacillus firmus]